ncbi:unnamed protein product [Cochlearia groenlandica]
MYFFGLSKEEVLSQKHVATYKETCYKKPITMFTLFGKQVYPSKTDSLNSIDGYRSNNIDLRLPANHYPYSNFLDSGLEANKANEARRNTKVVIDLEEPATTEHVDSVSYATFRTKPSKMVNQSLVDDNDSHKTSSMEKCLLDLNSTPVDELVSEPRLCFLQDLNCPYMEETETTSCEKSGIDDGSTPLCSPTSQNVIEKDGTASPTSYTSCCTIENNSRRSSSPKALEPSCRTKLEFAASKVLPEEEEEEEEEMCEMIQMAAESLVDISTVSHQNQDFQTKLTSRANSSSQDQDFLEKGKEKRGCSCDSYELLTLGIKETNTEEEEDLCVSSMAIDELNTITRDNKNREIGFKLKRGRRMKNFQKEILPSLTSLSRLEIREDINILEAVLRSREYKKIHGKTKDVKFRPNTSNKQRNVGKKRRKTE